MATKFLSGKKKNMSHFIFTALYIYSKDKKGNPLKKWCIRYSIQYQNQRALVCFNEFMLINGVLIPQMHGLDGFMVYTSSSSQRKIKITIEINGRKKEIKNQRQKLLPECIARIPAAVWKQLIMERIKRTKAISNMRYDLTDEWIDLFIREVSN